MSARTLLIGLDAADKDLLLEWAQAGWLPNIASLLQRSAWGVTTSPAGLFVGAVWPSFYTGVSPAKHGRHCYAQLIPGTYEIRRFSPGEVAREPFWSELSRAGRRIAIVDVPKTSPANGLNGCQLVDWGAHDPDYEFSSWPRGLAADVEARYGRFPQKCDHLVAESSRPEGLRDHLIARLEAKERLSADLLEQDEWDLFVTVFSESHCAGHQLWHWHDPSHPRHDATLAGEVGNPLQAVYVALDAAIGRLLERAGPQTRVFVLASHGMGPHYDASFMLRDILRRLEGASVAAPRRWTGRLLKCAWRMTPAVAKRTVEPITLRLQAPVGQALPTMELHSGQRSFVVPNNDACGGIRINQVGREPHGRVHPGAELETYVERLTRDLLALTNVDTGRPIARRVIRTAEHYRGGCLDWLPDLLVEWNREAPVTSVYSPKVGTINGHYRGRRTGDHKPEGLVLALGPSIQPGQLAEPVSVMDLAPTIADLLDVPLTDVDGRSIPAFVPAT